MKLNIQLFAYTKKEWKDLPSKDTPILAADLNNIENQLQTNTNDINTLSPDGHYGKTEIDNKENKLKAENEYLNSVIEQAFTPVEKEGTSINYDNTINARFKDIKLCGDTTQNGTPTPDTPVPVEVVTGDNTIDICGKNLLNIDNWVKGRINSTTGNIEYASNVSSMTIGENGIAFVVSQAWNSGIASDFIPIGTGTYTFTYSHNREITICIDTYDNQKVKISRIDTITQTQTPTTRTFTISDNSIAYIRIHFEVNTTNIEYIVSEMQLEKGSTATTYEPYQSQSYAVNLGTMELCKIGDYQDYIHKDNGKWYLNKQIGRVVLDGSESDWGNDGGDAPYSIYKRDMLRKNDLSVVLSNKFMGVSYSSKWNLYNYLITANTTANPRPAIRIKYDTNALTLDEFKTWLSTHNTIVYYVLATPTTTEITDTTLLEQLEKLAGAKTYAGETNIVATSDGLTIIPKTTALTK